MTDIFLKSVGAAAIAAVVFTLIHYFAPELVRRFVGQFVPFFILFFFYYQILLMHKKIDEMKDLISRQRKE